MTVQYFAQYRGSPVLATHPLRLVGLYRRVTAEDTFIDEVFHVDGTWHRDASLNQWLRGYGDVGVMEISGDDARAFVTQHAPDLDLDAVFAT